MPLRGCLARGRGLLLLPASRQSKPKTRVLGDQTIERGDSWRWSTLWGCVYARDASNFYCRWKQHFLEIVIFILFIASLADFLWYKLSPMIFKIIEALS
jgi:hypothetical protein